MSALQYSIVCYSVSLASSNTEDKLAIVEMLLDISRKRNLDSDTFGNLSNAAHLAAFLNLHNVLRLLESHGADTAIVNGLGLSPYEIADAITETSLMHSSSEFHPSNGPFDDSSEAGSINLESRVLESLGLYSESDIPDVYRYEDADTFVVVDNCWDTSSYPQKLYADVPSTVHSHPASVEHSPDINPDYTTPRVFHLSFDNQDQSRSRSPFRETCAIPSLDHLYQNQPQTSTHDGACFDHDNLDYCDSDELSDDNDTDLFTSSSLHLIHNPHALACDRSPELLSAMKHNRRFGIPTDPYFEYISALRLIARTARPRDASLRNIHWYPIKQIIVFRRHLHESPEDLCDRKANEQDISSFTRTWVYQEHGLDPFYDSDVSEFPYITPKPLISYQPVADFAEDSGDIEEDDSSSDSESDGPRFYGHSPQNVSTNSLGQCKVENSIYTALPARPLPEIPIDRPPQTENAHGVPPRRQNSLQRRTPPPAHLSLDTPNQRPSTPVMVWWPTAEASSSFAAPALAMMEPRIGAALKSPPPSSVPPKQLVDSSPMLGRLFGKQIPNSTPPSDSSNDDSDTTSLSTQMSKSVVHPNPCRSSPPPSPPSPPSPRPLPLVGLGLSSSETNLARQIVSQIEGAGSVIELGRFDKDLPIARSSTLSKASKKAYSAFKHTLQIMSPPPSPSLGASSSTLMLSRMPALSKRMSRTLSLLLPNVLDPTKGIAYDCANSSSSSSSTPSSEDQVSTASSTLVSDSDQDNQVLPKLLSEETACLRAPKTIMTGDLQRGESDATRSPQLYAFQQQQAPASTTLSSSPYSAAESQASSTVTESSIQSPVSRQSSSYGNQNKVWTERKPVVQSNKIVKPTRCTLSLNDKETPPPVLCDSRGLISTEIRRVQSDDPLDDMEIIHGVLHTPLEPSNQDIVSLGPALIDFQSIAHGLPPQTYVLRRSKNIQLFSDHCTPSLSLATERVLMYHEDVWTTGSSTHDEIRRTTLSNCESSSTTNTGVLFLRIKSLADFTLPIPLEGAMVSIRIDTGLEKIDTDYIPLEDVEMVFNQEFCIPVIPDLTLTLTIHLMQAPHLHPRANSSPFTSIKNISDSDWDDPLLAPPDHCYQRSLNDSGVSFPRSSETSTTASWRASAAATFSSRTGRTLASVFKKQHSQQQQQQPRNGSWQCEATASSDEDIIIANGARTVPCFGIGSSSSCSTRIRPTPIYPPLSSTGDTCASDRRLCTYSRKIPSSHMPPPQPALQSAISLASATKSTISKWKRNILISRKKRSIDNIEAKCSRSHHDHSNDDHDDDGDDDDCEDEDDGFEKVLVNDSDASNQYRPLSTTHDRRSCLSKNRCQYHHKGPISSASLSSSSLPAPMEPSKACLLTMNEIQQTETPLQVLSRHILFEDENCIARSGILFEDLREACTNKIVRVEFLSVNNWVDKVDYRINSKKKKNKSKSKSKSSSSSSTGRNRADSTKEQGDQKDFGNLEYNDFVVGKILTSLCFLPGQELDPEKEEDEGMIPTEPQNMLECQQGLQYFQWQNRISLQGVLFRLTENNTWIQAPFQLVGCKLWMCKDTTDNNNNNIVNNDNCHSRHSQQESTKEDKEKKEFGDESQSMERVSYLDLESVISIQTSLGIFPVALRVPCTQEQDEEKEDVPLKKDGFVGDTNVPFYSINSAFRLHMRPKQQPGARDAGAGGRPRFQDFYASTPEGGQEWVAALLATCQFRPPTPYWLQKDFQ
ncbi:hypothetical protein BG004_007571 [Podila humilis]|nr:hypothetical protein BG004_007571 [Podila humilis]